MKPMIYTLGTAAKATGKSKTTIQRAIKKGTISATKRDNGSYEIEASELHRVFPIKNTETPETVTYDTKRNETEHIRNAELTVKVQALQEMLEREREALSEMKQDRDAWKQQATSLLTKPDRSNRKWWIWK